MLKWLALAAAICVATGTSTLPVVLIGGIMLPLQVYRAKRAPLMLLTALVVAAVGGAHWVAAQFLSLPSDDPLFFPTTLSSLASPQVPRVTAGIAVVFALLYRYIAPQRY